MKLFTLWGELALKGVEEVQDDIEETTEQAEDSSSRMVGAFKKIGTAVITYLSVETIRQFGKAAVEAAVSVSAEMSAFEQIMGDYSDTAKDKMNSVADATGVVSSRLTPYMTSMTAKFLGLGYNIDDATTLATRGMLIASDAAAFWDMSLDESTSHLNSFINGSYEGGEAIGLFANDTQMAMYAVQKGIISSTKEWASLDEATKQATRLDYAEAMFAQSGATGQAAKEAGQYANVQANLTEKWRQFLALVGEPILQNIVIPAMQVLSALVSGLTVGFQALTGWMAENETAAQLIGITIGTLTAAIIAFTIAQNAATIATKLHAAATAIATAATTAWGTVMAFVTSPITLVIAAIGALIAIVVLLVKNWDTVKVKAQELWQKLSAVFTQIKNWIVQKFEEVKTATTNIWNSITNFLNNAWTTIKNVVKVGIMFIGELMKAAFNIITLPYRFIWENCKGIIMAFVNAVNQTLTNWINNVVAKFNALKAKATQIMNSIKNFFTNVWNAIYNAVSPIVTRISSFLTNTFNNIKDAAVAKFNEIKTKVTNIFNSIKNTATNVWNNIKNSISNIVTSAKNAVVNTFDSVKTSVTNIFDRIKNTASSVWNSIRAAIEGPINTAKETVRNVIETIKGFFNFSWSLPKLKMPHVSIVGEFSLVPPSVPKFSIDWYAKAMDNPMILDSPTIFGTQGGKLLGAGEAGAEVVAGRDTLMSMIQNAVDNANARNTEILEKTLSLLALYIPQIADQSPQLILDTGVLVGELAPKFDRELGQISRLKGRGR